jgi:hypothetical protein
MPETEHHDAEQEPAGGAFMKYYIDSTSGYLLAPTP